jgi:hypothetical protein
VWDRQVRVLAEAGRTVVSLIARLRADGFRTYS